MTDNSPPGRLNYLHWIEDLVALSPDTGAIHGIDIGYPVSAHAQLTATGVGASCIYPLLGARLQPRWTWTGTEVDKDAFEVAKANVALNNLQDSISLVIR